MTTLKKFAAQFIFVAALLLSTTSCVTNYYYVTTSADTPLYSKQDAKSRELVVVPSGTGIYISGKKAKYRKIKYGNYVGYADSPLYVTGESSSSTSPTTSSSTTRSTASGTTSSGKTVHVKGYYRKNGTYVQPHTRSAPHRK
jgi:hypothetical protein